MTQIQTFDTTLTLTCRHMLVVHTKFEKKWMCLTHIFNCSMLCCRKSTVVVSASLVKQLREETGAGMTDCKKALAETEGDLEKAQAYLRKKGLSSADKKSGRLAPEGRIGTYIHDARIDVLIEVNCESDFVGRSEKFKELVDDLAMQVAACPQVQFVSIEDIPETIVTKEKELEMQREDLALKPENIREKIVEGKISKRLGELALLE